MRKLTEDQLSRAIGSIVGSAAGDALGSQYEFGPSLANDVTPTFGIGYFGHAIGAWTDDTEMAIAILQHIAASKDGTIDLASIGQQWIKWAENAKDVGMQTRQVLGRARATALAANREQPTIDEFLHASVQQHHVAGRSGGNGSLMRTGPVALAGFSTAGEGDPVAYVAQLAENIAKLTHWEDDNLDACVLWSIAIYDAIETGQVTFERGLGVIAAHSPERAARWTHLINEATMSDSNPRDYQHNNGWVVSAFQAALSAITHADSYVEAMYSAIRGGGDTDTVAAIAGSLAGAKWGVDQIPTTWQDILHGWPGLRVTELRALTFQAVEL